jgi:hypothetical protein
VTKKRSKPPGRDEKMRGFEENRSPKRKNCGFDVTGADKLILAWHIIKEVAFLIFETLLF